ncbi:OmpA family protein [Algicella marina]|uniref:OmpA family protein n=1 Tax=Algicella marina TaxID=2683284 RepID=A0A6P1T654_9RHOB|nr:OmpA family protein [Algicella marina]QHQ36956.1 OmpA family protein [Algicella marina]
MASFTRPIILIAATGFGLAACTNPDGSQNRTGTGAAIGGLLGAATGAIVSGDDKKGAVIGGIAGAAVGAGIGNVLDRQARDLERDIGGSGARIINTGDQLIVRMPEAITFATESANVRPSIQDDILAIARNLQQYPNNTVQVIGHTDNTGTASFNQGLSERRASAVASLLRQGGVPGGRIVAFGRGETQPLASNGNAEGRAQNRRVEIIITPR